jgi:hypothetical protein
MYFKSGIWRGDGLRKSRFHPLAGKGATEELLIGVRPSMSFSRQIDAAL